MSSLTIVKKTKITTTPRLMQVCGLFNLALDAGMERRWSVDCDLSDLQWHVGLIVGPSGCGKSTIAAKLWPRKLVSAWSWPRNKSIVDGFPARMGIKDIVNLLCSVGFSSPPSWLRPFRVLSTGEQFRCHMARTLAEQPKLAVMDEFTSVVDRTVAKVGSSALAKCVRCRNQQFVAVTCHNDIAEWLCPDWIYYPARNHLARGCLPQRPPINLKIIRVEKSEWKRFRPYHYLDSGLNKASRCFVALWHSIPVAFVAVLHFPHPSSRRIKREHRVVCLPDFQGVGIGNAVSDLVASMCRGLGHRYLSITSHPAMMKSRRKSKNWHMICRPNITRKTMSSRGSMVQGNNSGQARRLRATFEYVGQAMARERAIKLWGNV